MAATSVEVVSPSAVLYKGEAEMVVCRSVDGEIAFLADHVPYLGALDPCLLRIDETSQGSAEVRFALSGGFVEVRDNNVVILADSAVKPEEINVASARSQASQARETLATDPENEQSLRELATAEMLLEVAGVSDQA